MSRSRTARSTVTRSHARWAADGRLLALVADGETEPGPLDFLNVEEGVPPLTREQIAEHLAQLDPEALQAVVDAAIEEGAAIDPATVTSETIERINALGDAREVAEERLQAIEAEEEQTRQQAEAALQRLQRPAAPEENPDGENPDGEDPDGENDDAGAGNAQQPEPVAASAPARRTGRRTTALPRPGGAGGGMGAGTGPGNTAPPAYVAPRATNTLVAAAGLDAVGLGTGATIEAPRQLGEAFGARIDSIRRGHGSGADGEHLTVATIRTAFPAERVLRQGQLDENTTRVREATSREVLVAAGAAAAARGTIVAAGGLCGPIDQLYDVPVLGSTARPVRDALANFGADRGGVKWREHLSFGDMADAIGFWTMADDVSAADASATDPYAGPVKPCADVVCPDEAEAYVEAITLCLKFRNVSARFDPEGTAANITAAQIAHARVAENRLLAQIGALSTTVTGGEVLGAVRDVLAFIDQLLAQYRSFYRLDDAIAIRCVLPMWVRNMLLVDMTRSFGSSEAPEALSVTDAQIAAWFQRRGVNVTWHLDGLGARAAAAGVAPAIPAQAYGAFTPAGAVAAFPASIEALMWVEGDMLHLDGGTLDLGVVRDSTLNQRNEYKTFSESWEGVAHRGVEAIRGVVTTRPIGMTSGTRDTAAALAA